MPQSSIIVVGALIYVVILIGISIYAGRRVSDGADYLVAGRKLPLSIAVFTVFATWFGSGTLVGAAGAAYSGGLSAVLANPFGSALCLLLAGLFYARVLRRLKLMTLPDLFRGRFGRRAEQLASACIVPAYIGWVGSIFVAFGTILNVVAGVDFQTAVIVSALITIAYTTYGGMWAVSLTDFFQAIVIIAGLFILMPLILDDFGGWQALLDQSPEGHFNMMPEASFYGWIMFAQGLLVIGLGNIASQDLLQRVFAARTESIAQWSLYIATGLYLTIAMIPVLIGIAAATVMPGLENPASVMPAMGAHYLPPIGMAIFTGALFSALISSADGGMLAPSSIIANNLMPKESTTDDRILFVSRVSVIVVGVLGIATALYFQSVYQLMVKSFSILMAGLFAPMTAALYWRRTNQTGVLAGIVGGIVTWLALEYVNANVVDVLWPAELTAAAVNTVLLIVVSLLTGRNDPPKPLWGSESA